MQYEGADFDHMGYSKGSDMAQEVGLVNTDTHVTGDFDSLTDRTKTFRAKGEFPAMNNTTDQKYNLPRAHTLLQELDNGIESAQ